MSDLSAPTPGLVVLDGPLRGVSFAVPLGHSEIGRQVQNGLRLEDGRVSRRHAGVDRVGHQVVLTDLRSINGTWVNGSRLTGGVELREGDLVQVGRVSLRFGVVPAGAVPTGAEHRAVEHQAVEHQAVEHQAVEHQAPQSAGTEHRAMEPPPAGGLDRVLMVVGFGVAMVGFGLWMYFIFGTFAGDPRGITNPFARDLVPGLSLPAVGLAVFVAGGILTGVGASMSRTPWTRDAQPTIPVRRSPRRGPRRMPVGYRPRRRVPTTGAG